MGSNIGLFLLTIAPSLLICQYIFRMDKYEREPRLHLFVCFLLGILCTLPALNMELLGKRLVSSDPHNLLLTFVFATLVIALSEEILKFFSLMLYAFPRKEFNEPMDGIVYSTMVSMGFATMENIMYVQGNPNDGFGIALARAFTAVPAHGLFALTMGYFIGKAKIATLPIDKLKFALKGLGIAILLHGFYDFLLLQELFQVLAALATLSIVIGWYRSDELIKVHQDASPFRDDEHDVLEINELALLGNHTFIQNEQIVEVMLHKMQKTAMLEGEWAEVHSDDTTGDKWLKFGVPSNFTEDIRTCLVRFPGPSINEIINLSFHSDTHEEVFAAAAYLRYMETFEQHLYKNKLSKRLEEFDIKELSGLHRERFYLLIEATDLTSHFKQRGLAFAK
jgi:protease PrsW